MKLLKNPIAWGIVSTLLVCAIGVYLGQHQLCDDAGQCQSRFSYFLAAPFNEIGDTLAGFAGALAFVWIIVTVSLQSRELAAQREELVLSREEIAEQRKATQDMARSLAAQAILREDEKKQRKQAISAELLDEQLSGIIQLIQKQKRSLPFLDDTPLNLAEQLANAVDTEHDESHFFHSLWQSCVDLTVSWDATHVLQREPLLDNEFYFFKALSSLLENVLNTGKFVNSGQRQKIENLGISGIRTLISILLSRNDELLRRETEIEPS